MDLAYIITFFVTFAACILSGIAGGGGSFITAPYWLISGMTPAQGAITGGFMAIGMGASSLFAFGKTCSSVSIYYSSQIYKFTP